MHWSQTESSKWSLDCRRATRATPVKPQLFLSGLSPHPQLQTEPCDPDADRERVYEPVLPLLSSSLLESVVLYRLHNNQRVLSVHVQRDQTRVRGPLS